MFSFSQIPNLKEFFCDYAIIMELFAFYHLQKNALDRPGHRGYVQFVYRLQKKLFCPIQQNTLHSHKYLK